MPASLSPICKLNRQRFDYQVLRYPSFVPILFYSPLLLSDEKKPIAGKPPYLFPIVIQERPPPLPPSSLKPNATLMTPLHCCRGQQSPPPPDHPRCKITTLAGARRTVESSSVHYLGPSVTVASTVHDADDDDHAAAANNTRAQDLHRFYGIFAFPNVADGSQDDSFFPEGRGVRPRRSLANVISPKESGNRLRGGVRAIRKRISRDSGLAKRRSGKKLRGYAASEANASGDREWERSLREGAVEWLLRGTGDGSDGYDSDAVLVKTPSGSSGRGDDSHLQRVSTQVEVDESTSKSSGATHLQLPSQPPKPKSRPVLRITPVYAPPIKVYAPPVKKSGPAAFPSWCRFPSHTFAERTLQPAGVADNVLSRDFAYERPGRLTSLPTKRSQSLTFGRSLKRKFNKIFSTDYRRSYKGHRSSISLGGSVEYPELEILPSVEVPIPESSQPSHAQQFIHSSRALSIYENETDSWSRIYADCVLNRRGTRSPSVMTASSGLLRPSTPVGRRLSGSSTASRSGLAVDNLNSEI